ncbi:MAG: hypothetical protein M1113_03145 [Candidatus Thermoplasmatota archaeon]|nr:hypothetical protein [Candidatus Thermoplasmatota archaeon]
MVWSVGAELKGFRNIIDVQYGKEGMKLSYSPKPRRSSAGQTGSVTLCSSPTPRWLHMTY